MSDKRDSKINFGRILLTAILSTGVFAAIVSGMFNLQIEKINSIYREKEIALEEFRFDEEKQARRDKLLNEWVPKIVSDDDEEKKKALAVLFAILPEEVEQILKNIDSSLEEDDAILTDAVTSAEELSDSYGDWIIIIASQVNEKEANEWINLAKKHQYEVTRYDFKEGLSIAIEFFPTEDDARFALIRIQEFINRGAYPLNFNQTCPNPEYKGNVTICK